ncbi:hypothetical protein OPKNFCMD_1768 [Methylobacterium crusticola]|uniref:L,D-TPase catalytic domain-containing protein n=1 Tax=Methylobacterium crusticola TaxID=1697972 RepID=A0ABQ4QVY0_9HYPH|nr:L,D-transpeptidase [Methylobacterium crusticola]GJD49040.1 hypothetical protein OPKNFCMD_1768 [Methylobacterium crusticola]
MRGRIAGAVAVIAAAALARPAGAADVRIAVDKAAQRMTVTVDGRERHAWPVSTGAAGYATPAGSFAPSRLVPIHYSREWDDAPMPHAIFFTDAGHAIHGSRATGRLGTPASHGCVRLAPAHARTLFALVRAEGMASTRIEIAGADPAAGTDSAAAGADGGYAGGDYRRLTSFNPLVSGIMAEAPQRARPRAP